MIISLQLIEEQIASRKEFEESFTIYTKNRDLPLEERWNLFAVAIEGNLFNVLDWSLYHSKILESKKGFSWYDSFNVERYETVKFLDIIDNLETYLEDALDEDNTWMTIDKCILKTQEEIDELKEEFLSSGFTGFKYDW